MNCPNCSFVFLPNTSNDAINSHIDHCLANSAHATPSFSKIIYNTTAKEDYYFIWTKEIDSSKQVLWKQEKKAFLPNGTFYNLLEVNWENTIDKINEIIDTPPEIIKAKSFEEKQIWFKFQIETMRIPWTQGADPIMITKENIINDTLNFIPLCDMHREIKIYIENDKVNDAGGLFREWIFLLSKELFKPEIDLFKKTDSEEFSFKINPKLKSQSNIMILFNLVGKILGKCLFERIPLNIYLDCTLMKHILCQKIELEDLRHFDSQLYKSLKFILENNIDDDSLIEEYFTAINPETNEIVELKTNGKDMKVNNSNKQEYVDSILNFVTYQIINKKIESLLQGFYEVIPEEIISIFTVEEFEILLNGLPFIDVYDWRENTEYLGIYNKDHEKIGWFWKIVCGFSQGQLSKLLQYCTGSSRVSIEGFRNLESNRGKFCKFCIESVELNKNNTIPKAYTCFNRLCLPLYNNFEDMNASLILIVSSDFEGVFGLG